ncbi:MAG: tRNA (guanosine(37)-N1)-methyltransferase TrmD [Gammaproteobacteria bacterium]|jgi:tRNA (guanine37-N1)-methyltransferase
MRIDVVTLFPDLIRCATAFGVTGRAIERDIASVNVWDPREFARDRHRSVDDRPYGGGPGMVMSVEPLRSALRAARAAAPEGSRRVFLSAQGRVLNHAIVSELAELPGLILLAGRYEGVDERLIESEIDEEVSIGDFVLSGGELPAAVLIDAVVRLLPGALGDDESARQDSFVAGLLDCPHYTRPEVVDGMAVPPVLLGGNHEEIRRWRLKQALGRTRARRPELLERLRLTKEQQNLLDEFIAEEGDGDRKRGQD